MLLFNFYCASFPGQAYSFSKLCLRFLCPVRNVISSGAHALKILTSRVWTISDHAWGLDTVAQASPPVTEEHEGLHISWLQSS
jgi:hypothetical protein